MKWVLMFLLAVAAGCSSRCGAGQSPQDIDLSILDAVNRDALAVEIQPAADLWQAGLSVSAWADCPNKIRLSDTTCFRTPDIVDKYGACPLLSGSAAFYLPQIQDGVISGGTILLNADILPKEQPWARRAAIAHEIGHALGFGHSRSYSDLMVPEIAQAKPSEAEKVVAGHIVNGRDFEALASGRVVFVAPSLQFCQLLNPIN